MPMMMMKMSSSYAATASSIDKILNQAIVAKDIDLISLTIQQASQDSISYQVYQLETQCKRYSKR